MENTKLDFWNTGVCVAYQLSQIWINIVNIEQATVEVGKNIFNDLKVLPISWLNYSNTSSVFNKGKRILMHLKGYSTPIIN